MVENKLDKDFKLFANSNGVSTSVLDDYKKTMNSQYISPSILEERQLNVTQMDVFSRLFMDRILFLGTAIDSYVANIINSQLLYLAMQNPDLPVTMYINSPGGVVYDGLSIFDTMNYISCPVSTTCIGMAASMGSILLAAGEKGKRFALPHSRVMLHQPMGGASGQASDIEIECREILKLKDELYQILSDCSGQSIDKIRVDADRDHWLIASEAKEYGLIDEIITKK